jgi:protein-L-isoaspartate(D-aspartate) O-methyltransferase
MRKKALLICLVFSITSLPAVNLFGQTEEAELAIYREEMVLDLKTRIKDERITGVFLAVPRHLYVPSDYRKMAYELIPIPLDDQKILPSPELLAIIFSKAGLEQESRVLVIGSACSYSAVLLSGLVQNVFVIDQFHRVVQPRDNIRIKRSPGWEDWKTEAPFDFIFVQDAVGIIPSSLYAQLTPEGILIFPLLTESGYQTLIMIQRKGNEMEIRSLGDCFFTPMYQ